MDRDALIKICFSMGMIYTDILSTLALCGIIVSARQLTRILRANGLYRRRYSDLDGAVDFIAGQLEGPGKLHGYRWMYAKCLEQGIRIRKEDTRILLSLLDPVNSLARLRRRLTRRRYFSKGPNFIWHVDSYDKLKPYGICINGCIDGYSRKIIWLRAAFTSSDPKVIGGYFAEAIEQVGGYPRLLRTDLGTENAVLRDMQLYLRRNDEDDRAGESSYITGKSTANQRIESWWGLMRREGVEYWIQLLGELKDEGIFTGDFVDKALVQLCFMAIIQEHLNEIKDVWNAHRIRPSKNFNVPAGIPNIMYMAPHLWGTEDHLLGSFSGDIKTCKESCKFLTSVPCDEDMFDLCTMFMEESGLRFPVNRSQALDLYVSLRDIIRPQIFEQATA